MLQMKSLNDRKFLFDFSFMMVVVVLYTSCILLTKNLKPYFSQHFSPLIFLLSSRMEKKKKLLNASSKMITTTGVNGNMKYYGVRCSSFILPFYSIDSLLSERERERECVYVLLTLFYFIIN